MADEALAPVEDVLVAVEDRAGADAGRVRACVRLGQGERDQPFARREAGQPAVLLLGRAGDLDGDGTQRLDGKHEPGGRAGPAQLLDRQAQRQQVCAQAAVTLLERDREDVLARQEPPDVLGPLGAAIDLGGPRRDLLVGEDRTASRRSRCSSVRRASP